MATPLGFSVETPLDMNSKPCRSLVRSVGIHAHARVADDPLRTDFDVRHRDAASLRHVGLDHHAAVHLLVGHLDPLASEANLGALVGRAVEALGKGAVHVGRHELAILLRGGDGAVVANLGQDLIEQLRSRCADLDHGETRILPILPNRDPL